MLSDSSLEVISSTSVDISASYELIILTNDITESVIHDGIFETNINHSENSIDYAQDAEEYDQGTDWYEPLDFSLLEDIPFLSENTENVLEEPDIQNTNITSSINVQNTAPDNVEVRSDWPIERLHLLSNLLSDDDISHFITLHKRFAASNFKIFAANYILFGCGSDIRTTGIEEILERLTASGLLTYSNSFMTYNVTASSPCIDYLLAYSKYVKLKKYIVKNNLNSDTLTNRSIIRGLGLRAKLEIEQNECIDTIIQYGFLIRYISNGVTKYGLLNI